MSNVIANSKFQNFLLFLRGFMFDDFSLVKNMLFKDIINIIFEYYPSPRGCVNLNPKHVFDIHLKEGRKSAAVAFDDSQNIYVSIYKIPEIKIFRSNGTRKTIQLPIKRYNDISYGLIVSPVQFGERRIIYTDIFKAQLTILKHNCEKDTYKFEKQYSVSSSPDGHQQGQGPCGIRYDEVNDLIYVCSWNNNSILAINPNNGIEDRKNCLKSDKFENPNDVDFIDDIMVVVSMNNHKIFVIDFFTKLIKREKLLPTSGRPSGLRIDGNRNIVVAIQFFGFFILDEFLQIIGKVPIPNCQLLSNIDIDTQGRIIISDTSSNLIRVYQ